MTWGEWGMGHLVLPRSEAFPPHTLISRRLLYFCPLTHPNKMIWCSHWKKDNVHCSLNSRDLFLNLRRVVKMTKPLRFENKSLRFKYKCLICIWIIFCAILDLFINPKYLFQNKSFSQTYYFKSEKSFVILTSLLDLKINPGNLESGKFLGLSNGLWLQTNQLECILFLELTVSISSLV